MTIYRCNSPKPGVTPAKAGVQLVWDTPQASQESWIPAFAGMTTKDVTE
jgi:hypothetical protein